MSGIMPTSHKTKRVSLSMETPILTSHARGSKLDAGRGKLCLGAGSRD